MDYSCFGYYIFSNEKIMEKLEKYSMFLILITAIVGVLYVAKYYGKNYTDANILKNPFTNAYSWLAIISILSFGRKYLNFNNKFTTYMTKNNFNFYVLHYTIELIIAFILVEYIKFNHFIFNYIILLLGTIIALPIITEIIKRIPIVNKFILGISKNK